MIDIRCLHDTVLSFFKKLYRIVYCLSHVCVHSVVTGFETCNKYEVKNNLGQQVFFAREGRELSTYFYKNCTYCYLFILLGVPCFQFFYAVGYYYRFLDLHQVADYY